MTELMISYLVEPCPFCGEPPQVLPSAEDVASGREGSAYGRVICMYGGCPTYSRIRGEGVFVDDGEPCADERGSEEYKRLAVKRWNGSRS